MGILSSIKSAFGGVPRPDYLASPFSDTQLAQIVYSDIFGPGATSISRLQAMGIPALSKARTLIAATIAKLPLKAQDKDGILAVQPEWMYRTDGIVSPFLRMLFTLDDLLFYGKSLWAVTRDADNAITAAERVPYEWWKVTPEGEITIREKLANADEVLYFAGPIEGLLDKDVASLNSARGIAAAIESRVKSPIPVMEIHATSEGDGVSDEEALAVVVAYNKARRDPEGATVFTPSSIELKPHGDKADSGFMVEGRNQVRLDVANMTGVPVALLDGSTSSASLTYSTQEGRRNEFVDFSLVIWMEAIAGRLSADDVVPSGQSVVFDQTDFLTTLPSPTGPEKQD